MVLPIIFFIFVFLLFKRRRIHTEQCHCILDDFRIPQLCADSETRDFEDLLFFQMACPCDVLDFKDVAKTNLSRDIVCMKHFQSKVQPVCGCRWSQSMDGSTMRATLCVSHYQEQLIEFRKELTEQINLIDEHLKAIDQETVIPELVHPIRKDHRTPAIQEVINGFSKFMIEQRELSNQLQARERQMSHFAVGTPEYQGLQAQIRELNISFGKLVMPDVKLPVPLPVELPVVSLVATEPEPIDVES